ncbi:MAG: MATE family efflux transporter [Acutalibacteraceae bacterium]|nr:MATE family efflux transporter [Acutalibacteraceae bacterium]
MEKRYSLDMTKGPFLKKILIFSLPLMLTGLLQLAYNSADVIVVGRFVGKEALAAVGSTGSLVNLFLNVFLGLSMGAGVMVARHIGERDEKTVHECVHTAMLLSVICGFFIGAVGFFASPLMLRLMAVPEDVIELASLYLRIYFMGSPGLLAYNFGASIIRATGDTKRPLYILTFSGLVNVVLNLILIIVFKMGVSGVAIATIVSQYLSAIFIVIYLMRMPNACRLVIGRLKIYKDELRSIIRLGLPAGVQNSLFSVSNVIIQSTVNSFGSVAMAGIAAGSNFDSYVYTCTNAVAQTTMTFTSQNMGAKKYSNIGKVYRYCILITLVVGIGMGSVGSIFGNWIVSLFSDDPQVIEIGAQRLALIMPFYFFCSLMDVAASQIRGMGKSFEPMIVSLVGACGIRLFWIYFILPLNRTLMFLYWAYPVSWAVTFFAQFAMYFILKRRMFENIANEE